MALKNDLLSTNRFCKELKFIGDHCEDLNYDVNSLTVALANDVQYFDVAAIQDSAATGNNKIYLMHQYSITTCSILMIINYD
jgi:hypothetical protein